MQANTSPNFSHDKLPSEILADIFENGHVSESQDDGKLQFVLSIASVCRRWRDVSTDLPSLWCHVVVSHFCQPDRLEAWLARSGNRLLNVNILACSMRCATFNESKVGGPEWNAVYRVLAPHISRCESLSISAIQEVGPALANLMDFIASVAMPTLRKLVMIGNDVETSDGSVKAVQSFEHDTPLLRDIRIQGSAAWVCVKLPMNHITDLHIGIGDMGLDYAEHLGVLLSSCPLLSTLAIYDSIGITYEVQLSPINVPNLRSLWLYGREPGKIIDICFILEQLNAPKLEEMHIAPVDRRDLLYGVPPAGVDHKLQNIKYLIIVIPDSSYLSRGALIQAASVFPHVERLTIPFFHNQFFKESTRTGMWPRLEEIVFNGIQEGHANKIVLRSLNVFRNKTKSPLKRVLLDPVSMKNVQSSEINILRDLRAEGVQVEETQGWNVTWPDGTTAIIVHYSP